MGNENRLLRLEERAEFQDQTLDQLSEVLIEQQKQIERLERELQELKDLLQALSEDAG